MIEAPISYQGTVYPWQCDTMGHMNVMWYTGKFDEATWQYFGQLGLSRRYVDEKNRGMAALEQTIKYLKEVHAGDVVTVRTRTIDIGDKTLRFLHEMSDTITGETVATSEMLAVHFDTTRRKSVRLPDDMRNKADLLLK